jgi:transposase
MQKNQGTLSSEDITKRAVLYVGFELSNRKWKLALSDGRKMRHATVNAGDLELLRVGLASAKGHFGMSEDVRVVSCYEAGRDGFWLHRYLLSSGIDNVVVDSASIEVDRRKRRMKTDRLDAGRLVRMLMRYHGGEERLWSVVRVPSFEDEDARHLHRELEGLKKERTRHRNRIRGILIQQGLRVTNPSNRKFVEQLDSLRTWDGRELPVDMKGRLVREYQRLRMVDDQIKALEKEKTQRLSNPDTVKLQQVAQLRSLYGIGTVSSWAFVMEFFGWREFRNRREIAALAGLAPTPYDSGGVVREQGISKAGSTRIRTLAIEIAWAWLRFQPQSKLSRWYMERFAGGGSRMRRIGIVAMARRLLIDLWRYLEHGVIPEGARLRPLA